MHDPKNSRSDMLMPWLYIINYTINSTLYFAFPSSQLFLQENRILVSVVNGNLTTATETRLWMQSLSILTTQSIITTKIGVGDIEESYNRFTELLISLVSQYETRFALILDSPDFKIRQ